ncbi:MAG TPA: GNAT family N-acetyltransferase [Acidimicrobiales bacterium]|nr:GNAT family N-acetyltransferase [Acidimicrobiales bacterium]
MTEPAPEPVSITPVRFDSEVARRLVAELDADLDVRYAGDDDAEGEPDYAMLNVLTDDVSPPRGMFLVAYLDDEPVGCGALRPSPTGAEATAEVKRMYVAPAARGRGISRRLLAALEDAAAGLGYRAVILETGIRQHEAMALYESAGYTPIPNYGAYRDSSLSRCYTKPLDGADAG